MKAIVIWTILIVYTVWSIPAFIISGLISLWYWNQKYIDQFGCYWAMSFVAMVAHSLGRWKYTKEGKVEEL
jgi:hypothetical protein